MTTPATTDSGQSFYRANRLNGYDLITVNAANRLLWRCPPERFVEHYDQNVSGRHLDVGPGTGYYLDRCRFPVPDPAITLLDLNPDPLTFVAGRIARYAPATVRADLLGDLPAIPNAPFDSIAINYVLHCLPDPPTGKQEVFARLKSLLTADGVLFGSTVVTGGAPQTPFSNAFNALYQRMGAFHNQNDTVDMLHGALQQHFANHVLEIRGSVALFTARKPLP
ncbi:class I SAM-dependent methyltransferase [Nocardia sp. XZ_19_369]|uniref:class I SAM-dependent methyltransferase n=1 Tax=Nocardia sp. XZ_19_369 TaxID=2769487 RepID=UPI00188E74E5|nr:class I SAM-dependent methyltransferase [Nocardia sp. XZ_19_369]